MSDIKLIVFGILLVLTTIYMDEGAAQRWCDTYQFCDEVNDHDKHQGDMAVRN